jgi:hypothetical protein
LGYEWPSVRYFFYFRCILVNQEELGIERFSLAVALNNEQIEDAEEFITGEEDMSVEPEVQEDL